MKWLILLLLLGSCSEKRNPNRGTMEKPDCEKPCTPPPFPESRVLECEQVLYQAKYGDAASPGYDLCHVSPFDPNCPCTKDMVINICNVDPKVCDYEDI